jgi:hypothetical protein
MTTATGTTLLDNLAKKDSEQLEEQLEDLLSSYQQKRSPSLAQLLVQCLEALIAHPQLPGGDEQRCQYCQLAKRWRYLAGRELIPQG